MNRFLQHLAEVCRQHPLTEKWLVAPNRRVGHQWLDSVCRAGQPVVNVRVKTIKSLAVDIAASEMATQGVSLATPRACALLVDRVLSEASSASLKYLNGVKFGTALVETVANSIQVVQLAGLDETHLKAAKFRESAKRDDLAVIMAGYRTQLTNEQLIDYADVPRIAIQSIRENPTCLGQKEKVQVLVPDDLEFSALEQQLIDNIPAAQMIRLQSDTDADETTPHRDTRIARAIGEVNEVRNALRRCVAAGIPWDEVELLHTDQATYVPLVFETLSALEHHQDVGTEELPVTFAEGISCRYSRPGRALLAWLKWIGEDYPQQGLVRMIKEGLLVIPDDDVAVSGFARLGSHLRGLAIGFGRERYLPAIDRQISGLQQRLTSRGTVDDAEAELTEGQIAWIERKTRDLQTLHQIVQQLLALSPEAPAGSGHLLACAQRFLDEAARAVNKLDRFSAAMLLDELDDMRHWLARCRTATSIDVRQWLQDLPSVARVLGSGPRPGCLHVDHLSSGGHSGRPHTFILGLDDSRFPGAGLQDPLLLDDERGRLSDKIPTASGRLKRRVDDFQSLLARLRGKVTLSYACKSVTDDREMFPSNVLVSVFRARSDGQEDDQQDLLNSLPAPVSFAPDGPERCLDSSEWWLWQLSCDEEIEYPKSLVLSEHPHLLQGQRSVDQQSSDTFTEYDGHVPAAGTDLDPTAEDGPVMSASRLQTLARCPRAFFFQHGLDISLPDDLEIDSTRWLDPLAFGSLVHALFEQFMRELVGKKKLPEFQRDAARLTQLLDEHIEQYRRLYPPPNVNALERQKRQLSRMAETFLREEEHFCRQNGSVPVYFEASLGMPSDGPGTALDTCEPIPLTLPSGKTIRTRGRIDRVDQLGRGAVQTYAVWDYKSGRDYGYEQADPLKQGRKVQPYLYATIVAHRLREIISPDAKVEYFGFFFPGERTIGRRLQWTPDELAEGGAIVDLLCQTVAQGAFVPTTDHEEDCRFCDYRAICGDTQWVSERNEGKLLNPKNTMLAPFRKLRNVETSS